MAGQLAYSTFAKTGGRADVQPDANWRIAQKTRRASVWRCMRISHERERERVSLVIESNRPVICRARARASSLRDRITMRSSCTRVYACMFVCFYMWRLREEDTVCAEHIFTLPGDTRMPFSLHSQLFSMITLTRERCLSETKKSSMDNLVRAVSLASSNSFTSF